MQRRIARTKLSHSDWLIVSVPQRTKWPPFPADRLAVI